MSGGFFRGTSADQDTRFSNKQAKLMKSQKFAPELDHLVDFTKVKADVVRPWIANRVTELLGFEDEVLINFIYGLLDGKEVNGKEIQISLTGFMEKNTGKFMKELWTLLLSAQKNASGVPQQFLDAKEEETRKKKAEADWIANEIQKKKEKESREFDQEKLRKMDGVIEVKGFDASLEPLSKPMLLRDSNARPEDVKETDGRNNKRGRNRVSRSPHSDDHSHSPLRGSPSRSVSKSISDSRHYSDENNRSRSLSRSHEARGRSISSERVYRSPSRRSVTPHRKHSPRGSLSPSRRRSFYSTQSRLRSHRRSPSPVRRRLRSPFRRRSPSPFRRRSPSPFRHRSPRRRSPSPVRRRSPFSLRRRSPVRRRSPSPMRRRSPNPVRRRSPSPVRRRSPSPVRRRSPSPVRRRSPSPVRRRSPSPIRQYRRSPLTSHRRSLSPMRYRSTIPGRGRSPIPPRRRSPSPYGSSSPSPIRRRSPSPVKRRSPKNQRRSPVRSPRERIRAHDKSPPVARRPPSSLRSPQRDPEDQSNSRNKVSSLSPSPERSPVLSVSPPDTKKRGASEDRRSTSPYENPVRQIRGQITYDGSSNPPQKLREQKPRRNSPETSEEEEEINYAREDVDYKSMSAQKRSTHSSTVSKRKSSTEKVHYKEDYSPERLAGRLSTESQSHLDKMEFKKDQELKSEKSSGRRAHNEIPDKQKLSTYPGEAQKSDERTYPSNNVKDSDRRNKSENVAKLVEKVDKNKRVGTFDTGSEESDKPRSAGKEKRRHKRSERKEVASDDDYSYESEVEGRKGSKRRRKEEKKLRKEEKRRRREERRRRREERRAEKLKAKTLGSVTPPSEREKSPNDVYASDGEHVDRRESRPCDNEEAESEQKKLEIELRKKALESLKAKKGIGH